VVRQPFHIPPFADEPEKPEYQTCGCTRGNSILPLIWGFNLVHIFHDLVEQEKLVRLTFRYDPICLSLPIIPSIVVVAANQSIFSAFLVRVFYLAYKLSNSREGSLSNVSVGSFFLFIF